MSQQRPRISPLSFDERFPSPRKASQSTEADGTGNKLSPWKKWSAVGLVAVWLTAGAAWLLAPPSQEEVVLEDLEELAYQYQLLQQKKVDGTDWQFAAEPLQERSHAVSQSLEQLEQPKPELLKAASTLQEVLRRPKRPDPRIEEIERQLASARQAIAMAD